MLVGNSDSGGAAVVAAARRPELVAGFVLSGAFVRTVPQNAVQKAATWLITRTPLGRATWPTARMARSSVNVRMSVARACGSANGPAWVW